jgi:hypothetical protein
MRSSPHAVAGARGRCCALPCHGVECVPLALASVQVKSASHSALPCTSAESLTPSRATRALKPGCLRTERVSVQKTYSGYPPLSAPPRRQRSAPSLRVWSPLRCLKMRPLSLKTRKALPTACNLLHAAGPRCLAGAGASPDLAGKPHRFGIELGNCMTLTAAAPPPRWHRHC